MFYTLEYKTLDSKGREKNASYVGVYKDVEALNKQKDDIIKLNPSKSFSFQIYTHEHLFS